MGDFLQIRMVGSQWSMENGNENTFASLKGPHELLPPPSRGLGPGVSTRLGSGRRERVTGGCQGSHGRKGGLADSEP